MIKEKRSFYICIFIAFACLIMALVDGVFMPSYFIKSLIKTILFLIIPLIFIFIDRTISLKEILNFSKKGFAISLLLGVSVYLVIITGYFLLRDVFDFSNVAGTLSKNIGVNKENFIFVSIYISFINSLLEEFFFRGFTFSQLKKSKGKKFSYIFNSLIFSVYHIAMMIGWFSVWVFILLLTGLFIGGIIFSYLNEKTKTLFSSYLVHMFANFAINTIGFILFGII